MLKIQNLSKSFGQTRALSEVSLEVPEGSIYTMIGPNGSGKTTIMKLAAGLLAPNAGGIEIAGADLSAEPAKAKAALGYIPDNPEIWSKMTGEEFLRFSGALYGINPHERDERIKELLPIFSLEGIEQTYFEHYSRGNRQKFAILAALLHRPKLLLVDEPIVGLDPESAAIASRVFREFADGGGAVFLATHTLAAAEPISDRAGVLSHGQLAGSGPLSELRQSKGLVDDASLEEIYHAYAGIMNDASETSAESS